jgi:hypothetical protein
MPRAVSIHIGVNKPSEHSPGERLGHSETTAWRMAGLAGQAGYHSIQVLRGPAATRHAVNGALAGAAGILEADDTLFVSFSGHGDHAPDLNREERNDRDEFWCLHDGRLLDDQLAGYWRLFQPGVRIVVVSESCHSGGMERTGNKRPAWANDGVAAWAPPSDAGRRRMRDAGGGWRGPEPVDAAVTGPVASCIAGPPHDRCGIRASVLMLTASHEDQKAEDGLFTRHLLDVWNNGDFDGSYCRLYDEVRQRVLDDRSDQHPQILIMGAADPRFALEPAFRVQEDRSPLAARLYRDGEQAAPRVEHDREPRSPVRYRGA